MHRRADLPFVYCRGSVGSRLVPRGVKGWAQFTVWLLLLCPLVMWLRDHVETSQQQPDFSIGVLLFCVGVVAWLIGGLWWMFAHAELVNAFELEREREYAQRRRQREERERAARIEADRQEG